MRRKLMAICLSFCLLAATGCAAGSSPQAVENDSFEETDSLAIPDAETSDSENALSADNANTVNAQSEDNSAAGMTESALTAESDSASAESQTEDILSDTDLDGNLRIEDGMPQPMLTLNDLRDPYYTNEGSSVQRFCVYVETDHDTDNDGMADLVKAFVQVPTGAVLGQYKAATIYDPTPYTAGDVPGHTGDVLKKLFLEKEFDYKLLYKDCDKRKPSAEMDTMEAAGNARPEKDWNYQVPDTNLPGFGNANSYDYYLIRGYAVVIACGIGTYGSEGYELCGTDLERDSHKCVIEWLTGDRVAYTDKENNIQIKADWSNGNVAMTGCSYGGTLTYEVATTGVKGLKTIIPYAGIASWYDYTNSQGVPLLQDPAYKYYLAGSNCGGVFLDNEWTVLDDGYRSWLWQVYQDENAANGNYAPIWAESDYSDDYENINCSALIVHGLNDTNVLSKQALLMYNAFQKANKTAKLLFHQNGHEILDQVTVGGEPWLEIQNKWLAHYLYDVDNGIDDMAEITAQNNITGEFLTYDSFGDYKEGTVTAEKGGDITEVSSIGLAEYIAEYSTERLTFEDTEKVFLGMDEMNAAVYDIDIPEGATIAGIPEVHAKLSTSAVDKEGLMITAVLIDMSEDGETFGAYMTKSKLGDLLPTRTTGELDFGGGYGNIELKDFVQSPVSAKCFSYGWTDLDNPGCGFDSSEYTELTDREAGKYYEYTFYLQPTFYTVEKGHTLQLLLMTWDPFRVFLDEGFELGMSLPERLENYNYSYVIDNSSLDVRLPIYEK